MALRWRIPLPGPFSVSGGTRGRAVWKHAGCYGTHPTRAAAEVHAAALANRTPKQMRRAAITGRIVLGALLGIGIAIVLELAYLAIVVH